MNSKITLILLAICFLIGTSFSQNNHQSFSLEGKLIKQSLQKKDNEFAKTWTSDYFNEKIDLHSLNQKDNHNKHLETLRQLQTTVNISQGVSHLSEGRLITHLNISSNRSQFRITRDSFQSLQIIPNIANSSTNFKLLSINPNTNTSDLYQLTIPGNWGYNQSSKYTLSCNLISQRSRSIYALLRFQNNSLDLYHTFNYSIADDAQIGQFCRMIKNGSHIYDLSVASCQIEIAYPFGNNNLFQLSPTFKYLLYWPSQLYRLNSSALKYELIYTFGQTQSSKLFQWQDRIIVHTNSSNFDIFTYQTKIKQSYYIMHDASNGKIQVLDEINIEYNSPNNSQSVFMPSLELTKFMYGYYDQDYGMVYSFKNVDYDNYIVYDVIQNDEQNFRNMEQLRGIVTDNYLVVRNYTQLSNNSVYVEEAYQFVGNSIVKIHSRVLQQIELNYNLNSVISPNNTSLQIFEQYPANGSTGGYNIFSFDYGSYQGNLSTTIIPPPTPFLSFNISSADSRPIISTMGVQNLQIIHNTVTNQSVFKITVLDRNSSSNSRITELTLPGLWISFRTANQTLSCNLVIQTINQTIGLLRYLNNSLSMISQIPNSELNISLNNFNYQSFGQIYMVDDYCIKININHQIYNINETSNSLTQITAPMMNYYGNFYMAFFGNTLQYYISYDMAYQNILYKYNPINQNYQPIFTYPTTIIGGMTTLYSPVILKHYKNRVIIIITQEDVFANRVEINAWVIKIDGMTAYLIDKVKIKGVYGHKVISMSVSPQLTKLFYIHKSIETNTFQYGFKNIDYQNLIIYDVEIADYNKFSNIVPSLFAKGMYNQNLNNFAMSQKYFVIRNDTKVNQINRTNIGNSILAKVYMEEGYQFVGNVLVFLKSRKIQKIEVKSNYKIIIDGQDNQLKVLNFYESNRFQRGYKIYEHNYGQFSGTVNQNPLTYPTALLYFKYSQKDDIFIDSSVQSSCLTISSNSSNITTLQYFFMNRTAPSNISSLSLQLSENWSYLISSPQTLSCSFLFNNQSLSLAFVQINQNSMNAIKTVSYSQLSVFYTFNPNISNIKNVVTLGQGCDIAKVQQNLYNLRTNNLTIIDVSSIFPSNQKVYSSSLNYIMTNDKIYKFQLSTNSFIPFFEFISFCLYPKIFEFFNRVVAVCQKYQNFSSSFTQKTILIYVFVNNNLTVQINDTYLTDETQQTQIFMSPNLTKLYYNYKQILPNSTVENKIKLKSINYAQATIIDLSFPSIMRYQNTIGQSYNFNQTNFAINDEFLVVRNDSSWLYMNLTMNLSFVEEGYQFTNNSIQYVNTRVLRNSELGSLYKMKIDSKNKNELVILDYYLSFRLGKSYKVIQTRMGNYTNPTNQIITSPTVIYNNTTNNSTNYTTNVSYATNPNITETVDVFINPSIGIMPPPPINSNVLATFQKSVNNQFITSNRLQYLQIINNGTYSSFIIKSLNRSNPANTTQTYGTQLGIWRYVNSSQNTLGCIFAYDQTHLQYALFVYDSHFGIYRKRTLSTSLITPNVMFFGMKISQDCSLGLTSYSVYNLLSSSTNIQAINPPMWVVQTSSASLQYIIANNILYMYTSLFNNYTAIKQLKVCSTYNIIAQSGKLIIWGANSTQTAALYNVSQIIYILTENNKISTELISFNIYAIQHRSISITVRVSPQMTKIHYEYLSINQTQTIQFKSINYQSNQITSITLKSKLHYLTTKQNIANFTKFNYFLGDYYLLIRNDTAPIVPSQKYIEQAYQFVGQTLIHLRMRTLNVNQLNNCYKLSIDSLYANELVAVNSYYKYSLNNTIIGVTLNEFKYGNIATTVKIIPATIAPFANLPKTNMFTSVKLQFNKLGRTYVSVNSTNTEIAIYTERENETFNFKVNAYILTGVWEILADTPNCKILHQTASNIYQIYKYNSINETFTLISDITSILNNLTTPKLHWKINTECTHFVVDFSIFYQSGTNFLPVNNSFSDFFWLDLDQTFTYAITLSQIFKLSNNRQHYIPYYNNTLFYYYNQARIISSSNRIIIYYYSNASILQLEAYIDNNTGLICVANFSLGGYAFQPKVSFSPNLTKIVIYGEIIEQNITKLKVDSFFIDYSQKTKRIIDFPVSTITDPNFTLILLEQNWIYIRQIQNPAIAISTIDSNLEFVYYIDLDIIPVLYKAKNISDSQTINYQRTVIKITSTGQFYVLTEVNRVSSFSILLWQNKPMTSQITMSNTQPINTVITKGKIKLCPPGCIQCQSGICTSCQNGFIFDISSMTCSSCGLNCHTCLDSNPNICLTCVSGAYLSSSMCLPCDSSCTTCQVTPTSCKQCLAGQYYNNVTSTCKSCPRNCLICNESGICTQCNKGFALSGANCRGCSISCSDCSPTNIMTCTACSQGLQLYEGSCIQCPSKCNICNNGKCAVCITGYHPNSIGKCVQDCQLPCASCSDNKPKQCTTCFSGSILNGIKCQIDLSCNNYNNCTYCGPQTGYILVGANCLKCGGIKNCIQCKTTNSQICALCAAGYYLNDNRCAACPNQCSNCISSSICTSCLQGYTLPKNKNKGKCRACAHPCLTCEGTSKYCTSCVNGFTKKGWKCQNNINIGFSFKLVAPDVGSVLNKVDEIVTALLVILKMNSSDIDAITFTSIKSGSVDVDGNGQTSQFTSTSALQGSLLLSSACTSGSSIGSFSLTSCSVVANGVQQEKNTKNLTIIFALAIGIPLLLIIIIGIIIIYYRLKARRLSQELIYNVSSSKDDDSQIVVNIREANSLKISVEEDQHIHKQQQYSLEKMNQHFTLYQDQNEVEVKHTKDKTNSNKLNRLQIKNKVSSSFDDQLANKIEVINFDNPDYQHWLPTKNHQSNAEDMKEQHRNLRRKNNQNKLKRRNQELVGESIKIQNKLDDNESEFQT